MRTLPDYPTAKGRSGDRDATQTRVHPRREQRYRPPNFETRVLTGMRGKLWIERNSFQWVNVEVEVIHPVHIGGFIARVEPGTRFELEKIPVSSDICCRTKNGNRTHRIGDHC